MRGTEKKGQALSEKVNPVFNTAKTTLFQLMRNGNPHAAAIAEKMGLTGDTQRSKSFSMSPDEETTFRIVVETRYQAMVECRALDYISSAGLRVLLIMQKGCEEGVSLSGVNNTVGEILEQTGFGEIFRIRRDSGENED